MLSLEMVYYFILVLVLGYNVLIFNYFKKEISTKMYKK